MKERKLKDMECMSETEKLTTKADGSETFSKTWVFEGEDLKVTIVGAESLPFEPGQKQNIIFQQPQSTIEEFQDEDKTEEAAKEETFQEHIEEVEKKGDSESPLLISAEAFNETFDTLGGLAEDVRVEKNVKDNFLFAHAYSKEVPTEEDEIEHFCAELTEFSVGLKWTHVGDNLFNADKEQLNKEEPEGEQPVNGGHSHSAYIKIKVENKKENLPESVCEFCGETKQRHGYIGKKAACKECWTAEQKKGKKRTWEPCACGKPSEYVEEDESKTTYWCADCMDPNKICRAPIDEKTLKEIWKDAGNDMKSIPKNLTCTLIKDSDSQHEHGHMTATNKSLNEVIYWRNKRAIFIKTTTVRGQDKDRWECPDCQKRWNRDPKKKGSETKCPGCDTVLLLVTTEE
jgi:hypothetical protein